MEMARTAAGARFLKLIDDANRPDLWDDPYYCFALDELIAAGYDKNRRGRRDGAIARQRELQAAVDSYHDRNRSWTLEQIKRAVAFSDFNCRSGQSRDISEIQRNVRSLDRTIFHCPFVLKRLCRLH